MQNKRASEILKSIIQGVDPRTDKELTGNPVLQDVDVLRALLAGTAALDGVIERDTRRATLPENIGKPWSKDEQTQLIEAYQNGTPMSDIAAKHGRSVRALEIRLQSLGVMTPSERSTSDLPQYK